MARAEVVAAGAVVLRKSKVLLVHRPKYDDWSFPKGKLEDGEHVLAAAIREVEEETSLRVRLGVPLEDQCYPTSAGAKRVHYWSARTLGDHDVSGHHQAGEIDQAAWVDLADAARLLTYEHDRDTLEEALASRTRSRALVVLRHAEARKRGTWRVDDRLRPLTERGEQQADELVAMLGAFGVTRVATSPSTRCLQTVQPFVDEHGLDGDDVRHVRGLSEEDADPYGVEAEVRRLLDGDEGAVLCSHRPVLPLVWDALNVEKISLPAGGMLVVHHDRGHVLATELHAPCLPPSE